jgi:hypothetical protein
VEDHVGAAGDELFGDAGRSKVVHDEVDRGRCRRRSGREDVRQRKPVDGDAVERAVFRQPLRQLAPDHPGRAGDEDMHGDSLRRGRACPGRPPRLLWHRASTIETAGTSPAATRADVSPEAGAQPKRITSA